VYSVVEESGEWRKRGKKKKSEDIMKGRRESRSKEGGIYRVQESTFGLTDVLLTAIAWLRLHATSKYI